VAARWTAQRCASPSGCSRIIVYMERVGTEETVSVARHLFTVEDYHKMGEVGILGEDDRVELVAGEIVNMSPIGWRHVEAVNELARVLWELTADRYTVSVQNPTVLGERDEPQPDLALLARHRRRGRVPTAEDASLVVEVADPSLTYDHEVKLPRYAGAGIREVWIVNLEQDLVEVYSEPGPEAYGVVARFGRGTRVVSATVPGLVFDVAEILPHR
jgi:Uma2 family endonuclease